MRFSLVTTLLALSAQSYRIFAHPVNDDVSPFIYGGEEAAIGEFPYYVYLGGCGGSLIARDMVLSAAHCPDSTGREVKIGAYNNFNLDGGAQVRTCTSWTSNPFYSFLPGKTHDMALCKLNSPVDIDESEVKLQMNRDTSFELANKDLTACGLGILGYVDADENSVSPNILQRTTLRGMSDTECKAAHERLYGAWSVYLVCADGDKKTDVCRGDSGGPLVRIEISPNGGPDIHYHIGTVSYGNYCPAADVGVYARTSEMAPWIDEVMCKENSVDKPSNCPDISDDSEDVECVGTESKLVVTLTTDAFPLESTWAIVIENATDGELEFVKDPIRYDSEFTTYTNTVCLEANVRHQWMIFDKESDGLCYLDENCGSFFVTLNGVEIFSSPDGIFTDRLTHIFFTPDGPISVPTTPKPTPAPTTPKPTPKPTSSPTRPLNCGENESRLVAKIKTDLYPEETAWALEAYGDEWIIVDQEDTFENSYTENITLMCLEPDTTYRWNISDSASDGLYCQSDFCEPGYFYLILNGAEIFSKPDGIFGVGVSVEFTTPDVPIQSTPEPTPKPTSGSTRPLNCGENESGLVAKIQTDRYPEETAWALEAYGDEWIIVDQEDTFENSFTEYITLMCLEPDTTYRWKITDSASDGLHYCQGDVCERGYFYLTLNGEDVDLLSSPDGVFTDALSVEFTTQQATAKPTKMPKAKKPKAAKKSKRKKNNKRGRRLSGL